MNLLSTPKLERTLKLLEIKLEPAKQMIIQEITQEDRENFLFQCYIQGYTWKTWVDGMILDIRNSTSGDSEYVDMTKGKEYYEQLVFVKFPKYKKIIKWYGGKYRLVLLNYNNDLKLKKLARWIKSQPEWENIPERLEL